MSVREIQSELTRLSPRELADVARFLTTLRETNSPEYRSELTQRHRDMDAGRKISESELARILAAKPTAPRA